MPDRRRRYCRSCGKHTDEVGELSWTGLCTFDSVRLMEENALGIHAKSGPAHERRRYGIALAEFGPRIALGLKQAGVFDGEALDDVPASP